VIELYAITDAGGPPLPEATPLESVEACGLAALCAPATEREVSADALWRHEELVEALMEERDLLPVRYGTCVDDAAAAARVLEEQHDRWSAALDRVRGAVELSLRVIGDAGGPESGAEYLQSKAEVRALQEPLEALARASARRPARAAGELLRAAYLVDRGRVQPFVERVAELQAENPDFSLLCTGPWPPYSFVEP
jgi:gas vesicle protein GvpL/GvpF